MTFVGAGLAGAASALVAAAIVCGGVAWAGPMDRPRDRGSHSTPTPTSGGLGVIAGTSLGLLTFALLAPRGLADLRSVAAALGLASALGFVGALDDLFDLGARIKFVVQIALALLFALFVARIEAIPITGAVNLPLGPVVGVIGTTLWLLVVVNAVNFMDGANGLAPGGVAIVLIAFASAAFIGGAPTCGAAALTAAFAGLGFLPWNFPSARLFQGDAGALFSGFLLAALAVIGAGPSGRGGVFVLFVPLTLLPFLVDVLLTLLLRARRRKPLFEAHSEHLYQRWLARSGRSHLALALRAYGLMAAFALAALALIWSGSALRTAEFALAVFGATAAWALISRQNP